MFFSWIHESSHIKTQGFEGRLIENIGYRGGVRYFIVREWCSQQDAAELSEAKSTRKICQRAENTDFVDSLGASNYYVIRSF